MEHIIAGTFLYLLTGAFIASLVGLFFNRHHPIAIEFFIMQILLWPLIVLSLIFLGILNLIISKE